MDGRSYDSHHTSSYPDLDEYMAYKYSDPGNCMYYDYGEPNFSPTVPTFQHFRFLDLSPELRNRIYSLAIEQEKNSQYAPLWNSSRYRGQEPIEYGSRFFKFFALTQTCRQVRYEYRPIWFSQCPIQIWEYDLEEFVNTFMPTENDLRFAPKLLQLASESDGAQVFSLKHLLKLRAHCPSFYCEFVPETNIGKWELDKERCFMCQTIWRGRGSKPWPFDPNLQRKCTCDPQYLEDYERSLFRCLCYVPVLSSFVHNMSKSWLQAVRNGHVRVCARFKERQELGSFSITLDKKLYSMTKELSSAANLVKN